jgi:3-methyladenine DNA glycosylase AlkC
VAEPLKNSFGPEVPQRLAGMLSAAYPAFDRDRFLTAALAGYEALELTQRAWHVTRSLRPCLPVSTEEAIGIIVASLGPEIADSELQGMGVFLYLPYVFFVAEYGLDTYEASMRAQYELTKRFTSEFSIRAFLERFPEATLDRLGEWSDDPNVHVRRLVSEGTRPRLPWAPRLQRFIRDPAPVLALLERLKDDSERYVQRSVANNLNDIAKDHPDLVADVARRWMTDPTPGRGWIVRHGLRTLVKQGHPGALAVLGFDRGSPVETRLELSADRVEIGGKLTATIDVHNPTNTVERVVIDMRVHFVKAAGGTSPKVFKVVELEVEPGGTRTARKTVSLAQHTTRTHYPGRHTIELIVNGETRTGAVFELV